jgi:hypothetical protein
MRRLASMATRRQLASFLLFAILAGAAKSQESTKPTEVDGPAEERTSTLRMVDVVVVESELGGIFLDPLRCDSEGNVYMRGYDARQRMKMPIRKFDPQKGVRLASFSLDSVPELEFESGEQFFVSADGDLHWLTATETDRYILSFGKDGAFKSKTKLDFGKPFMAYQLAAFSSGEFLISGLKVQDSGPGDEKRPFTGVFDKQGKLVRSVTLQDDAAIHEAALRGDSNFTSELHPGQSNRAVSMGVAVGSADGNVYLMRRTSPALVYAVSAAGTVVRRISVDPGDPVLLPVAMHEVAGRLAIMFWDRHTKESVFKIVETHTGNVVASYGGTNLMGFTCYSPPRRFTFLATKRGKLAFGHAEPQ